MAAKKAAAKKAAPARSAPAAPPAPPAPEPRAVAELRKVESAIADIGSVGAGLKALQERYAGFKPNVTSPTGMVEAKAARQEIREPRYRVEAIRKAAKAPILEMGRLLDREAQRITDAVLAIEGPIDTAIRAEEQRVEDERAASIEAERQRLERIQQRLAAIRALPSRTAGLSAVAIFELLAKAETAPLEGFDESTQEATDARAAAVAELKTAFQRQKDHEAERERVAREAEELRVRQEADAKARRDDELRRQEEQRKLDERAAELRRQEEEHRKNVAAREALDKLNVGNPVEYTPAQVEADDGPADAVAPMETPSAVPAWPHPGEWQIITALSDHFSVPRRTVIGWLIEANWEDAS